MRLSRHLWTVAVIISAFLHAVSLRADGPVTGGGQLELVYDDRDAWVYFETPDHEVAYNVQIIKAAAQRFFVCYHGDPKGKTFPFGGDSIRCAIGTSALQMPARRAYAIFSHFTDRQSYLYSEDSLTGFCCSGGGNPMAVKVGSYYYIAFLSVAHDDHPQRRHDAGWRHYLHLARTLDFTDFELLSVGNRWCRFAEDTPQEDRRPELLRSGTEAIRSSQARAFHGGPHGPTHGLIGSMVYHDGKVYYFYTDCDWCLKCRITEQIADPSAWSPAMVLAENLMEGTIVRVAKSYCPFDHVWRWVVVYNCYRDGHQDLGIEYTRDLSLESLRGLHYNCQATTSPCALGIRASRVIAQHFWLTDPQGALEVPDGQQGGKGTGGMLTWLDSPPMGDVRAARWSIRPR